MSKRGQISNVRILLTTEETKLVNV